MHTIELILINGGKMPLKGSRQSAGYDLFSNEKLLLNHILVNVLEQV